MDLCLRYWDNVKGEVMSRYITSAFLGHSTAYYLLDAFKSKLFVNVLKKILQISMDGPNVNFKLLRDLKMYLLDSGPDAGEILEIRSCGLHTVHGAFKTGVKHTKPMASFLYNALVNSMERLMSRCVKDV